MIASLIFTFTDFNITEPDQIRFVGIENYRKLFSDPDLQTSLLVTLRFTLIAIPISVVQPIAMAALLNAADLWGKRFFTTLFYMPFMVPLVSVILIWRGCFKTHKQVGLTEAWR